MQPNHAASACVGCGSTTQKLYHAVPHDEDEVYFVLKGRGTITLGGQPQAIAQGSILYVPADTEHEFTEISEDLSLLVFFGSGGPSGADV